MFYHDFPQDVQDVLDFETAKFTDVENCYASFDHGFVEKGLKLV